MIQTVQNIFDLEALVGRPPALVMMKQIPYLDEGCIQLLAHSSIAGFGYLTESGSPYTTIVGGIPGFVKVESPNILSFTVPLKRPAPVKNSGASFVFLLPGVGEVLRLNGKISKFVDNRITIAVEEAFIHCARAILRSQLWSLPSAELPLGVDDNRTVNTESISKTRIADFLANSPFILLSSWDDKGCSDTSPRGDPKGFLRFLDERTLALPDRQGNQRTDSFHNIISNNQVSLVALVPGSNQLLHLSGTASITNDKGLLDTMCLKGKAPQAALLLDLKDATITQSEALAQAQPWLPSSHSDPAHVPDMMALALHHLSLNKSAGRTGRFLGWLLSGSPGLIRALMNVGYRSQLKKEGYAAPRPTHPLQVRRPVLLRLISKLPPKVVPEIQKFLRRFSNYLSNTAPSLEGNTLSLPMAQGNLNTREVKIVNVKKETRNAVSITVEDISGNLFEFKPGQFFTLFMNVNGKQVIRSYSASNAPGTNKLTMTVKKVANGLFSNHVNQHLQRGDRLALRGPSGTFFVTPESTASRQYILIAGGSGVTPIMSIAQTVLAIEPLSSITVLYGNRQWEDVIFAQAWADLCQSYPDRLRVLHFLSAPHAGWTGGVGRLDEAAIKCELINLTPSSKTHFYVCGPESMMQGVTNVLSSLQITTDRIHTERFSQITPPVVDTDSQSLNHQVMTITQEGATDKETIVAVGQTLLQASLNARFPLPFSCGMGNCGECRVKLIVGQVIMGEPNCLTADDRKQGYILTCVARPVSSIIIEVEE
jgi:ferredoxin-NADP reductase/predicted pyridoxine 5'-phosphate oxidase superfamily flavin-nucleotide-binding protein